MKTPKYVLFIEHFSSERSLDRFQASIFSNLIDLFSFITRVLSLSEDVFHITVFEIVRGSQGRVYEEICSVNTPYGVFEVLPCCGIPRRIRKKDYDSYIWL